MIITHNFMFLIITYTNNLLFKYRVEYNMFILNTINPMNLHFTPTDIIDTTSFDDAHQHADKTKEIICSLGGKVLAPYYSQEAKKHLLKQ
jgi:hypothetical protein